MNQTARVSQPLEGKWNGLRVCARGLGELCERSLAQATRLGRGCAVVQLVGLPQSQGVDLLDCARGLDGMEGSSFYWECGEAGEGLAAGRAEHVLTASGEGRFEEMEVQVECLQQEAVVQHAPGVEFGGWEAGALLVGGFSFQSEVRDGMWTPFGAGRLGLPGVALMRQGGRIWGVLQGWATAEDRGLRRRMEAGLERLWMVFQGKGVEQATSSVKPGDVKAGDVKAGDVPVFLPLPQALNDEADAKEWLQRVGVLRDEIERGSLNKVALGRLLRYRVQADPYAVCVRLRERYPQCYSFCIALEGGGSGTGEQRGGVLVGASPERLVRVEDGLMRLSALAGTHPRGLDSQSDAQQTQSLRGSAKEQEEHRLVVDDMVRRLTPLGKVCYAAEPGVMRLDNVQHLHTPLVFHPYAAISPLSLLGKLHPTPAVGGHPQEHAMQVINQSEKFERGWFASPIGWLQGRMRGEFAVALRCGLLMKTEACLFAGAGIVAGSQPRHELHELQLKLQPMLQALQASV